MAASYSYWTFGDVFEELGVPSRPFHGGFGMIANQLIPKPTMWTFAFFNNLKGECIHRDERSVILRREDGSFEGVVWNLCREERDPAQISLILPCEGPHCLMTRTVDEECCNPLKCWHEMGQPSSLTDAQLAFLRQSAQPLARTQPVEDGTFTLVLGRNAVVHFTLSPVEKETDFGYDYEWYRIHS